MQWLPHRVCSQCYVKHRLTFILREESDVYAATSDSIPLAGISVAASMALSAACPVAGFGTPQMVQYVMHTTAINAGILSWWSFGQTMDWKADVKVVLTLHLYSSMHLRLASV